MELELQPYGNDSFPWEPGDTPGWRIGNRRWRDFLGHIRNNPILLKTFSVTFTTLLQLSCFLHSFCLYHEQSLP